MKLRFCEYYLMSYLIVKMEATEAETILWNDLNRHTVGGIWGQPVRRFEKDNLQKEFDKCISRSQRDVT